MKTLNIFKIFLVFAAFLFVSCSKDDSKTESEGDNPLKSLSLSSQEQGFVNTGNAFALEFLDRINQHSDDSFIISPLSMQYLLGMMLNGAQEETQAQIIKVLGYGTGQTEAVNKYCLSLMNQLSGLDKKTKIHFANAAFADKAFNISNHFKTSLKDYYKAEVSNKSFSDPKTLEEINSWCKKQTNGNIPQILDCLSKDDVLLILNTLYFNSTWKNPFDVQKTTTRPFYMGDGGSRNVSMMAKQEVLAYAENEIFSVVNLPYGNSSFQMYIFLPKEEKTVVDITGSFKNVENFLTSLSWKACDVDMWLPRFETKYDIELNHILSSMGIPDAFDKNKANFKSISDKENLCLSLVKQCATIKVDEEGTVAAVVSTGKWYPIALDYPSVQFHADHPFVYMIIERSSQAILFAGKYTGK